MHYRAGSLATLLDAALLCAMRRVMILNYVLLFVITIQVNFGHHFEYY
jgi:hypothetical protein